MGSKIGIFPNREILSVPRNLRGLKSYDHEIWHVGPLSDRKTLRSIRILIFGRKPKKSHKNGPKLPFFAVTQKVLDRLG